MSSTTLKLSLEAFWIALGTSALISCPVYRLLLTLKSRQTVSEFAPEGHQAKQGTPTMGGLIVLVGLIVGILFVGPRVNLISSFHDWQRLGALVGLVVAFAAIGFVDDFIVPRVIKGKRGLGWKQKIVLQVIAGLLAPLAVGAPPFSTLGGLIIFVVLFFSNAYNFSDGLDGLAACLALIFFFGLALIAGIAHHDDLPFFAVIGGAFLPFLFLNAPPAKVFMGDVGSLPIGALMGLLVANVGFGPTFSIANSHSPIPSSMPEMMDPSQLFLVLCLLSLVMIAELIPPPMQIFWVKVFKKRLFPYTPIHHAFEKAGWKETKVVFVFGIAQALCVAAAITVVVWLGGNSQRHVWEFNGSRWETSVDR